MRTRAYSDLITLPTIEDRYKYLKLDGKVGQDTFGSHRYLNQTFYQKNSKWLELRNDIIVRDHGCNLGVEGFEIYDKIIIHHINPITLDDILEDKDILYDPENLITVSSKMHQAIHYGDPALFFSMGYSKRAPNDTCPWKKG